MDIGNTLWLAGIVLEAVVLVTLFLRRIWRTFPFFTFYCVWDLINNGLLFLVLSTHNRGSDAFTSYFLVTTIIDAIFILAVLTEVFWSVLRPLHSSLPRQTIFILVAFLILASLLIWPFTAVSGLGRLTSIIIRIQQVSSLLRILVFLLLAACSQFLSLSWRDRELQVATGLGFYSLVSFGAMLAHSHGASLSQYILLNQIVVASYVSSLLYWVYSFAQQEAERREFTPQMQNFLLAAAGVAREQRLALVQASMERHRQNS